MPAPSAAPEPTYFSPRISSNSRNQRAVKGACLLSDDFLTPRGEAVGVAPASRDTTASATATTVAGNGNFPGGNGITGVIGVFAARRPAVVDPAVPPHNGLHKLDRRRWRPAPGPLWVTDAVVFGPDSLAVGSVPARQIAIPALILGPQTGHSGCQILLQPSRYFRFGYVRPVGPPLGDQHSGQILETAEIVSEQQESREGVLRPGAALGDRG
jgi:hypothetical protein